MFTVTGPEDLLPGDLGFKYDLSAAGRLARAGQWLLRDDCPFWHVYGVVKDGGPASANPFSAAEAMPRGFRLAPLASRFGPGYGYVRLPLSPEQREAFSTEALALAGARGGRGVPYSFADYLALALWEWHAPGRTLVRDYVTSSERMICSQAMDHVLCKIGFHLFSDGRLPQDVPPGQLFWQGGAIGEAFWWPMYGPAKNLEIPSSDQGNTSPIMDV